MLTRYQTSSRRVNVNGPAPPALIPPNWNINLLCQFYSNGPRRSLNLRQRANKGPGLRPRARTGARSIRRAEELGTPCIHSKRTALLTTFIPRYGTTSLRPFSYSHYGHYSHHSPSKLTTHSPEVTCPTHPPSSTTPCALSPLPPPR